MDVTFVVVSDTHVGYGYPDDPAKLPANAALNPVGLEKDDAKLIARVNAIAGRAYPAAIGGGAVAPPRGLVVTGDLTEWGRKIEWDRFVEMFGRTGKEGLLKLPLFEMVGNHDKVTGGPWIADRVAERHGGAHFYSWDWDDLHLVALGEAPDDEGFAFLARDLARVAPDVPLVLFFHRALAGPWSTDNWFDDAHKARLARALTGRSVAAIFHGHHHATGHYVWHGIDVWKPGAVKNGAHTFAVVHATDTKWTLASYDWDRDAWASTFTKPLPPPPLSGPSTSGSRSPR
jgi:3',5'-cyclic AMP phosphodiesterase CpdA